MLGILVCMLALAVSAYADGAWVLWINRQVPTGVKNLAGNQTVISEWTPVEGFQLPATCASQIDVRIGIILGSGGWPGAQATATLLTPRAIKLNENLYSFYCLPDGTDPRGAKEK
jgi:hypothetical protein